MWAWSQRTVDLAKRTDLRVAVTSVSCGDDTDLLVGTGDRRRLLVADHRARWGGTYARDRRTCGLPTVTGKLHSATYHQLVNASQCNSVPTKPLEVGPNHEVTRRFNMKTNHAEQPGDTMNDASPTVTTNKRSNQAESNNIQRSEGVARTTRETTPLATHGSRRQTELRRHTIGHATRRAGRG